MKLASCHPERKHQARGMCKPCYDRWLKASNPGYRERQLSNTTKWARANPEKMAVIAARRKQKDAADPTLKERSRERQLKRTYGITQADYDAMLASQNGGCAICGRKPGARPLHVDHCHDTGAVRGLLCHQCNWYLGTVEAGPNVLNNLLSYLSKTKPDLVALAIKE